MQAIVCEKFGLPSDLVLKNIELPEVGERQIRLKIKACSVNFPDTLIIQGLYQHKPELPFVPGSDIAGIVVEVGAKVKHLKVNDEVFGFTQTGGYAEEAVVDANTIFPKPPNMSYAIAASFLVAYGTSYHALVDRANVKEGETVLVLGASGGVGLAAVEIAKQLGAKVIAAASTNEKLELCTQHGADMTINYAEEDLKQRIKELTEGQGVDVIYDPVGGNYSEIALRGIGWRGRYLVVGFAAGDIPKIPLNLPLLKVCQIVGVFWGRFAMKYPGKNMENSLQLIKWYTEGKINPHIHKMYPLAETPKALEEMMARQVKGKVVISID